MRIFFKSVNQSFPAMAAILFSNIGAETQATDLIAQNEYGLSIDGDSREQRKSLYIDSFILSVSGAKEKEERFKLIIDSSQLGSSNEENESPGKLQLDQNYPDPFNPATTIGFYLPVYSETRPEEFDLSGSKAAALADGGEASRSAFRSVRSQEFIALGLFP